LHFEQKIEGFNVADLGAGTASAKTVTLSFWVKSSIAGTYSLHFGNDTDRFYVTTYVINATDTWEQKSVTLTLATSGTWNTTNGRGLEVLWSLLAGSDYTTSTLNQWITSEDYQATGSVQFGETLDATFQVTGVQLEVGTVATSFDFRSYGTELQLCQRYFRILANSNDDTIGIGTYYSATSMFLIIALAVEMRATPSIYQGSVANQFLIYSNSTSDTFDSFSLDGASTNKAVEINNANQVSGTAGYAGMVRTNTATSSLGFSAEL
jgi:hypothetical protein